MKQRRRYIDPEHYFYWDKNGEFHVDVARIAADTKWSEAEVVCFFKRILGEFAPAAKVETQYVPRLVRGH